MTSLPLFLMLGCVWGADAVAAAPSQSLNAIREAAANFVAGEYTGPAENLRVEVGRLDERLRLDACAEPLEPFYPAGSRKSGNVTVGIRCTGPRPWSLYVPVSVKSYAEVQVLARPVARGAVLTAADLRPEPRDTNDLIAGFFTAPGRLVGKTLVRSLAVGQVLTPATVAARTLVRRGERVVLSARTGALVVRVEGEALADGAAGDLIPVRNVGSKRVVEGVVSGSGNVTVRM